MCNICNMGVLRYVIWSAFNEIGILGENSNLRLRHIAFFQLLRLNRETLKQFKHLRDRGLHYDDGHPKPCSRVYTDANS